MIDPSGLLPVHGFVLAGGKSTRMGRDKALVTFHGTPMAELAVMKLRSFCSAVSFAGNRNDLHALAEAAPELRVDIGPAAGVEAGLLAAAQHWCLYMPVDVPVVPAAVLRRWAAAVLALEPDGVRVSCLRAGEEAQPTFCMLHTTCLPALAAALDLGQRRLYGVLMSAAKTGDEYGFRVFEAEDFLPEEQRQQAALLFANANTPEDLAALEMYAWNGDSTRSVPVQDGGGHG